MFRIRDSSITKKLAWMNMMVSGGALLLACAAFVAYNMVTFRQTLVRDLSTQAQIVGANSVSALLFNDPKSAENTLAALKAGPNIESAWIYSPDRRPFAAYGRDRRGQALSTLPAIPPGRTEAYWFKDNHLILVRSIMVEGKPTGFVYIVSDLQEMYDRLKRYAGIVAMVLATSLIAALLISSKSRRSIAQPIENLAEIARIVSTEKQYSIRAAKTGNQDELAVLIDAFNEMLAQIQQRDAALQKTHEQLNLALKSAGVGTWSWDMAKNSVAWDEFAAPLYGLEQGALPDEYAGSLNLVHPEDRERLDQAVADSVEKGVPYDTEFRVVWPDGSTHVLGTRGNVYRDEPGKAVQMAGVVWDMTKRKRAEEEHEQLASIVESSDDAIISKTLEGNVASWNGGARRIYGYSAEEMVGKPISILAPPDRADEGEKILERIKKGETVDRSETRRLRKDGAIIDVSLTVSPIRDANGRITCASEVGRDVTDRKRAEDELRKLNEELDERVRQRTAELEASNKELEAFTYSVSHDLRAPLRHIDGFSKLLAEEHSAELSEVSREFITLIRESTREMGQLVDDLLNLARVGRRELSLQVTGLDSLVEAVVTDLQRECKSRAIDWKVERLPFVECDPGLMKQVFTNLLSNAVKYSRPRDRAVIEVGTVQDNGQPAIFVRDNGVGFSMKYSDKLFGVFQRLHRAEDFEGTGVGLATVKRIIQKHEGRVWAEAELDRGATFYFTLGTFENRGPENEPAEGGAR